MLCWEPQTFYIFEILIRRTFQPFRRPLNVSQIRTDRAVIDLGRWQSIHCSCLKLAYITVRNSTGRLNAFKWIVFPIHGVCCPNESVTDLKHKNVRHPNPAVRRNVYSFRKDYRRLPRINNRPGQSGASVPATVKILWVVGARALNWM